MKLIAIAIGVALAAPLAAQGSTKAWAEWDRKTHRICPSHHLEWIADGTFDDLLGAFEQTLPAPQARQISRRADLKRRCAKEIAGRSCEMAESLKVYSALRIMDRFAAFSCREVRCETAAYCSRFPSPAAPR